VLPAHPGSLVKDEDEPMTEEVVHLGRGRTLGIIAWIAVPVVALILLLYLTLRGGSSGRIGPLEPGKHKSGPSYLALARTMLAKQTDANTCRQAVEQLNSHLNEAADHAPGALSAGQKKQLQELFGLDRGDLAEVSNNRFTHLDSAYLETCFLLRDAARSLELTDIGSGGKLVHQEPLERARLAFAWVMRQVRQSESGREPMPPAPVLRRGSGSSMERALVFLALLEQFGLEEEDSARLRGCLVTVPNERGSLLWACGVAVGPAPTSLHLFDPRLGLPVPGPKGEGIATLAQARSDPGVLGQLQLGGDLRYDVTPELAKKATLYFTPPLSALAPRMKLLQDRLLRDRQWHDQPLPAAVRVRLAEDVDRALKVLRAAARASGGQDADVLGWKTGPGVLRRFLPKEEGGTDKGVTFQLRQLGGFTTDNDPSAWALSRQRLFHLELAPWRFFPARFRDPTEFRPDIGVGQRLRTAFMLPFVSAVSDPESPRDLLLRGRFTRAATQLAQEEDRWLTAARRLAGARDLDRAVDEWVLLARNAQLAAIRAQGRPNQASAERQVELVWRQAEPVVTLLFGIVAEPRGAEVTYQLGLCHQERAERLQARVELARRAGGPGPTEPERVQAWERALSPWKEYIRGYDESRPESTVARKWVASARRRRGEGLAALGKTSEAVAAWDPKAPGAMTKLEKLAAAYLAKRLEKK
jgi:hypothetical protein